MTLARASDAYALELVGLGVVWTTRAMPAVPGFASGEDPDYRNGALTAVGGVLRASVELLDAVARNSGLSFSLSGDLAGELLRGPGEPVRDTGTTVRLVQHLGQFHAGSLTVLRFTGPLVEGDRYIIGDECIRVLSGGFTDDPIDSYVYTVTRGARLTEARDRPVYWREGEELDRMPAPLEEGGAGLRFQGSDLVYPDREPPTLTGWPVRLWLSVDGATPVVVYRGAVSEVSSSGASVQVSTTPRSEGELARPWQVPAGGLLSENGDAVVKPIASVRLAGAVTSTASGVTVDTRALGVATGGDGLAARGVNAWGANGPVYAIPKASLADASDVAAVQIVLEDGTWLVCPVGAPLSPGFQVDVYLDGDDDRPWVVRTPATTTISTTATDYHYLPLRPAFVRTGNLGIPGDYTVVARVGAWGRRDELYGPTELEDLQEISGFRVQDEVPQWWLDAGGPDRPDRTEDTSGRYPRSRVVAEGFWQGVVGGRVTALPPQPARMFALPRAGTEQWAPEVFGELAAPLFGGVYRSTQLTFRTGTQATSFVTVCARSPHLGRTLREVAEAQLGPQAYGVTFGPDGLPAYIDWRLAGTGRTTTLVPTDLRDTVSLVIGTQGRVSTARLRAGDQDLALNVISQSVNPHGLAITRDVAAVFDAARAAGTWAGILSRYTRTVPMASFSLRWAGDGRVFALRPGSLLVIEDPASLGPDGTRGLLARGVILEVSVDTTARAVSVRALLIDYGQPVPSLWGPCAVLTSGDTGTDVTLDARDLAGAQGLWLLELYRAAAGTGLDVRVLTQSGTATVTATLEEASYIGGTLRLVSSGSQAYAAGNVVTLGDSPAQTEVGSPTGYWGITRWI